MSFASSLGLSSSNELVRSGLIPDNWKGFVAPGYLSITEGIPSLMKGLQSPDMPPIPPSAPITDPSIAANARKAAEIERKAILLRRGRSSTILGGQETLGDPFTKKATLLGGV
jgi:hypothetical protein